jgi:hypothetical protein
MEQRVAISGRTGSVLFKAQGLEIQPIFVRGGPMALAALSSGEVDFAEIGDKLLKVAQQELRAEGRLK